MNGLSNRRKGISLVKKAAKAKETRFQGYFKYEYRSKKILTEIPESDNYRVSLEKKQSITRAVNIF